jgi:hypothetical protein
MPRPVHGVDTPTLGAGVEVSAVLRSILTGRFDPGGRRPEPVAASPSMPARAPAGDVATTNRTGTEGRAVGFGRVFCRRGSVPRPVRFGPGSADGAASYSYKRPGPARSADGAASYNGPCRGIREEVGPAVRRSGVERLLRKERKS